MKTYTGWIKLHRQIQDNGFWLSEKFTKPQAWVDLILLANHTESSFFNRGVEVRVGRGQLAWAQKSLAVRWKWSNKTVIRFLEFLEKREMIHRKTDNVCSVITINNYDRFQESTLQTTPQNTPQTTPQSTPQSTLIQECKNEKNDKKLGSPVANHAEVGKVVKAERKSISYPREIVNEIVNYYVDRKGIAPQGNEWLPIQQSVKTMLMSGRTPQDIKDLVFWLSTHWSVWDMQTVMKRMPEFLAGKLDAEKNKVNPIVSDPIFKQLSELTGSLTDTQMRYKMMLESKLSTKYPTWRFEKEWTEATRKLREERAEKKDPGIMTEFRDPIIEHISVN